ncbi:hypothetical protein PGT21_027262 [Puccinia graminis f. sp. tritici]|uniref:Uncharacterized protein n=1 Tax=Puccinia graminis f. sp. tritici TaxID=56615 RepID=A0A5B0LRP9_PUCGR|nr:hypothetical protein PGT21_027262 [Puccinia graminis f. sp. tritici]KAA1128406.1 hypothetical protein PGTUg99_021907 [Puccinia graminis f. sp. tritici]
MKLFLSGLLFATAAPIPVPPMRTPKREIEESPAEIHQPSSDLEQPIFRLSDSRVQFVPFNLGNGKKASIRLEFSEPPSMSEVFHALRNFQPEIERGLESAMKGSHNPQSSQTQGFGFVPPPEEYKCHQGAQTQEPQNNILTLDEAKMLLENTDMIVKPSEGEPSPSQSTPGTGIVETGSTCSGDVNTSDKKGKYIKQEVFGDQLTNQQPRLVEGSSNHQPSLKKVKVLDPGESVCSICQKSYVNPMKISNNDLVFSHISYCPLCKQLGKV